MDVLGSLNHTVEKLIGENDFLLTLISDVEIVHFLAKTFVKSNPSDENFSLIFEEMQVSITTLHRELLQAVLDCLKSLQGNENFIQKMFAPWIYLSNSKQTNQVNTPLDQLLIIVSDMIDMGSEKVVDFFHFIGILVFEKLHLDDLSE